MSDLKVRVPASLVLPNGRLVAGWAIEFIQSGFGPPLQRLISPGRQAKEKEEAKG